MEDKFCWIAVAEESASLSAAYDGLRREDGSVHNLYRAFSQFPAPVASADQFYREIMHTPEAPLPMWLAELLSVDVAIQNKCTYALTHHGANFGALFDDQSRAEKILEALKRDTLSDVDLDERTLALLAFGRKLTHQPEAMVEQDVEELRSYGYTDAEISQAVQVTASFAYWTRFINALGIKIGNERVGKYG